MMPDILINGKLGENISVLDRGFLYGDGLFETILVESGVPLFFDEHIERLCVGCLTIGFPEIDTKLILDEVNRVINHHQYGIVKLVLSRGQGERGFLPPAEPTITRVISFEKTDDPITKSLKSMGLLLCDTRLAQQPKLAGIKHLNQLERILARSELRGQTNVEGLMLDVNDFVIEGTMSNLFVVKDGVVMTPALSSSGVAGVMRDFLIKRAQVDGVCCKVSELSIDDVKNADEIFMTNSVMLIRAIDQLTVKNELFKKKSVTYTEWALRAVLDCIHRQTGGVTT
jgi:4-amino-4-deoxychorismate lyase